MPKRLFCLAVSLCLCSCAEIVLLATSAATTDSPAMFPAAGQPPKEEGVTVRVLLRDAKGNPVTSAGVLAYPGGQEQPAHELSPGEYQFDSLPVGNGINFEAFKDGMVASGHFTPLRDTPNLFEMQFK